MTGNVIDFQPGAATPGEAETLEAAVLEVSGRISSLNAGKRRLYTRLDQLRSGDSSLRRRRPRAPQLTPLRPVIFYSIEEASPSDAGGRLRAAGGGALMSDQPAAYRLDIPVHLCHEIGRDPAELPEHRAAQIAGVRSLQLCAGLFWASRQLALMAQHGGWVYTPSDLFEALEALGEIGQAVALSASDHVERLEHLAERHAQAAAGGGGEP